MLLSTPGICSKKSRQSVDGELSRGTEAVAVHNHAQQLLQVSICSWHARQTIPQVLGKENMSLFRLITSDRRSRLQV